jgi:hypothetical protein
VEGWEGDLKYREEEGISPDLPFGSGFASVKQNNVDMLVLPFMELVLAARLRNSTVVMRRVNCYLIPEVFILPHCT